MLSGNTSEYTLTWKLEEEHGQTVNSDGSTEASLGHSVNQVSH
jgi:hypothetical protein